jgi:hypothetical protein
MQSFANWKNRNRRRRHNFRGGFQILKGRRQNFIGVECCHNGLPLCINVDTLDFTLGLYFLLPFRFKGHSDASSRKDIWVYVYMFCCIFTSAIADFRSESFGDLNKELCSLSLLFNCHSVTCTLSPITVPIQMGVPTMQVI